MLFFLKRFIYTLSNKIWQRGSGGKFDLQTPEKKIIIDFSKIKKSPFDIKSESSYNANLSNGSLFLGIKKQNYIAWTDIPERDFHDHIIEAKIHLDNLGGYAAAGIIFHITDETTYYLALVSSKGYFRIDAVKDSAPRTLIAWTEISDFDGNNINLKIITYGTSMTFLVNEKWLGEANDDTAVYGRLGFAIASYLDKEEQGKTSGQVKQEEYVCKAYLDYISIDTRTGAVEECFNKWTNDSNINAEERLRLAETFAVMNEASKSLDQINRAWKRRDEAILDAIAEKTEVRTRKELLLAARMSFQLGQYYDAEAFIDSILDQGADTTEGKLAFTEKVKIFYELERFEELKDFVIKHPFKINKDLDYYIMIARCYWELKEYKDSAEAWDKAFDMSENNGIYAVNAANAHENAGLKKEALTRYITAGKIFLNQDNKGELEAIMPKLSTLGSKNWEARTLSGKWAFSIEDYNKSAEDFAAANKIRSAQKPRPPADPAAFYLWALVLNLKGKCRDAVRLLEKSVELAPEYGLFRFKLAEIKLRSGLYTSASAAASIVEDFKLALKYISDDSSDTKDSAARLAHYAGKLLEKSGDKNNARYFLERGV